MKHYTAMVEVSKRGNPTPDEVDAVMDRLAGYPVSLSVTPRGYRAAHITLPADNLAGASTAALLAVTHGYGLSLDGAVSLEVMSESEADLREGSLEVPDLIGATEAAQVLGVSPQRVRQMIEEGKLAAHRIGERSFALVRSEVEATAAHAGVPGFGKVLRDLGLRASDVVATPVLDRRPEYSWTTPSGESIESEDPPPPGIDDAEQRIVSRYRFRVLGGHEGGILSVDDAGREVTAFEVVRYGDWTTVD